MKIIKQGNLRQYQCKNNINIIDEVKLSIYNNEERKLKGVPV